MRNYYFDSNNAIRFYCNTTGRNKNSRKRQSYTYVRRLVFTGKVPFRVENYFAPTFEYSEYLGHRRNCKCGYDVVKRGIWRNNEVKNAIHI